MRRGSPADHEDSGIRFRKARAGLHARGARIWMGLRAFGAYAWAGFRRRGAHAWTKVPSFFRGRLGRLGRRPRVKHLAGAAAFLGLAAVLFMGADAFVRARLDPLSVDVSTRRVYARPPVLTQGSRPRREWIRSHLERIGYREARGREVGIGEFYLGARGWVLGLRPVRGLPGASDPGFAVIRLDSSGRISRIENENGTRLDRVILEPEFLGLVSEAGRNPAREDRIPVRLEEVPGSLVQAVLTVEDQRFFEHRGLDYRRIGAAFLANVRAGEVVQGGSTLTQQLAKNLFLTPRRSLVRKLREAMMASTLERRYTKEEILQAYLNHVYLGQRGAVGIHGVGRAAQHFFGKDVSRLDLAESALLVALIRAPSAYSPFRNPETAVERRNLVLRLMLDRGVISEEAFREASDAPLALSRPVPPPGSARYFLDFVRDALAAPAATPGAPGAGADLAGLAPFQSGDGASGARPWSDPSARGTLVTSLDSRLQRAAEEAVRDGLTSLERDFDWLREGQSGEPLQAALVALDPRTGGILAMVGGRDYAASQFNRAVHGRRQPGSAFKPVVALAALSRPRGQDGDDQQPAFTLASVVADEPLSVETPVGLWEPANYSRTFSGQVTLRDALERSLNVPFARLGLALGPERIVKTARDLGVESDLKPYPSLALGASEVTPLELARAYGVLAAGGFRADLRVTFDGEADVGRHGAGRYVVEPAEAFLVTSALRGAVERGTGQGIRTHGFYGDVAAKSGTTNDFRDGWFVGYTPTLVVAVWVGFDHGKRLELPGAGVALPIFSRFLAEAVGPDGASGPWAGEGFAYPPGLEIVDVNTDTGLRGGWGCSGVPELFLEGTAPRESCGPFRLDRRIFQRLMGRGGEDLSSILRRLILREGEEIRRRRAPTDP